MGQAQCMRPHTIRMDYLMMILFPFITYAPAGADCGWPVETVGHFLSLKAVGRTRRCGVGRHFVPRSVALQDVCVGFERGLCRYRRRTHHNNGNKEGA